MTKDHNVGVHFFEQGKLLGLTRSKADRKQELKIKNSTVEFSMRLPPNNIFQKDFVQNRIFRRNFSTCSTRNDFKSYFNEEIKIDDSTIQNPRTTYSTFKSPRLTRVQYLNQKIKFMKSSSNKKPSLGCHFSPLKKSEKIFQITQKKGIHSKLKIGRISEISVQKRNKSKFSSLKQQTADSQSHRNQMTYFIPSICKQILINKPRKFPFGVEKMKLSEKPLKKCEYMISFQDRRRAKTKEQKQEFCEPWKKQTFDDFDISFSQIIQLNS